MLHWSADRHQHWPHFLSAFIQCGLLTSWSTAVLVFLTCLTPFPPLLSGEGNKWLPWSLQYDPGLPYCTGGYTGTLKGGQSQGKSGCADLVCSQFCLYWQVEEKGGCVDHAKYSKTHKNPIPNISDPKHLGYEMLNLYNISWVGIPLKLLAEKVLKPISFSMNCIDWWL